MPFMLCNVTDKNEYQEYLHIKDIKIAGNSGPIINIVKKKNQLNRSPFPWHINYKEIIEIPDSHEIIIDLKPNVKENVSLYKLVDIWGYSYDEWSPLALRLETIFSDKVVQNPKEFKKKFKVKGASHEFVHEFLYLQGGVKGGTWNWGMVGGVNGALLWKDAFKYFISELSRDYIKFS